MQTDTKSIDPTTLHFREGNSDKVYQAAIEPAPDSPDRYHVTFAYGRRGNTLTMGTKTPEPVTLVEAIRIHARLVASKLRKGYTRADGGTPYKNPTTGARDTGIRCQLLNPVEEHELPRLIADHRHLLQEKFDGRRMLVRKQGREVTGINRRGLEIGIPAPVADAVRKLPADCLLDGEAVGEVLHIFDLLEVAGRNVRDRGYLARVAGILRLLVDDDGPLRPVSTASTPEAKRIHFDALRQRGAEGVVFKDSDAAFSPGRPNSGGTHLKFKFVETASFLVAGRNGTRRSVGLEVVTSEGKRISAGNVTIPANHDVPGKGSVVEVRYLYAIRESGAVYQPVYLGPRDDIPPDECTVDQLKFKAELHEAATP